MFFENTFFFIKIIHIGEVFEVMKNNHQAKKGLRGRGGVQVVSATGQESCISKFRHALQEMSRLRELKITKISDIQSQFVRYV